MIDLVMLALMRDRKGFNQLYGAIPTGSASVDPKTIGLIKDFKKYFEAFPAHDSIDLATFLPRFAAWHPTVKEPELSGWNRTIVAAMQKEVGEDERNNILQWLAEIEMATAAANLIEQFNAGDAEDVAGQMTEIMSAYKIRSGIKFNTYIDIPIEELLNEEFDDSGIAWRLACLNRHMRRMRGGDFGVIAGRPDKGKTTFLSSEITFMAPQLPDDKNVLWLNNEGPGKRIIPRNYQSALGVTLEQMREMSNAGTLVPAYRAAIGGRLDKIRIVDIHGMTNYQVKMIIEDNNPGVTVFDMIDNIKGFGTEARTDRQLEEMYKWARECCVEYDMIGLATSQISNEGDGLQFPTLGMLKDSKTGKQGANDFQLMIGASNDPSYAGSRFLGLPKNKLKRPGVSNDPRAEVIFDADKARYIDIDIGVPGVTHGTKPETPSEPKPVEQQVSDSELASVL